MWCSRSRRRTGLRDCDTGGDKGLLRCLGALWDPVDLLRGATSVSWRETSIERPVTEEGKEQDEECDVVGVEEEVDWEIGETGGDKELLGVNMWNEGVSKIARIW